MNIMMVAASTGLGMNPALPANQGMALCFFLATAGVMLLSAAALMVTAEQPRHAVRYARVKRGPNGA